MLIAGVLSLLLAQGASPDPAEAVEAVELTRLEQVWNDAHLRGDAEALERLWADDLVVAVPRMRVLTRDDALGMARSGRMRFERYATSDLRVRTYGDSAVVTGRLERSRVVAGKATDDRWLFTKVYVRQDGRWRVVAFHASDAPE